MLFGFLLPLGYAVVLSAVTDSMNTPPNDLFVMPIGWPRPVWLFFFGDLQTDNQAWVLIAFAIAGNILVYGTLVCIALSVGSFLRTRSASTVKPPPVPTLR